MPSARPNRREKAQAAAEAAAQVAAQMVAQTVQEQQQLQQQDMEQEALLQQQAAAAALQAQMAAPAEVSSDPMEPSSDISVAENDSDSDFEEPKPKGKRKARGDQPAPPAKRGKRAIVKKQEVTDSEAGSLFDMVKNGRVSLQSVGDDWIESYKNDRDNALLELIQFFIQCSGCKGKITPYMHANMEHAEIIRKMTEEFDEESGDYPLIMAGPLWKKFKSSYCEFVQVLVRQCQYSIIYDQYMMDNVISLLTGLTDSQVRAFRHTSTVAAMKLMTALVDVALNLSINLDNTQRQYEAERQKNQNKRATERLELLLNKRQELEENQEEIRNMLTYIFKGVFVHRYRDTQPEIRSICMREIGVWMKKYPNMFLDDSYLKYVGWTLYDKVGDVRLCCLKSLCSLYDSEDLATKMELFTNRFKDRIVEMTLDKEYEVAVQAVKLVICVLRYSEGILTDKDSENVYELVYSSHRQVAQAAGEFLNSKLFQRDDEATKNLRTKKGKKRSPNTPLIRDLVQFFIESELHEHGAYLVDSLWEINDMTKDWECMTDLLLEEPGKDEEVLDDRQETSLIEIMVCCVKQAATGESPVGRGPNRKLTARESKQVMDDKTKLTEHFIVTVPHMLNKYLMDAEKIANLLLIAQYFDLEIYTTSRQEKNLELLLRYLQEIVDKHTDTEVLEACSKVFECLCSEEYAIAGKCDVARSTLVDSLVRRFKEAMHEFFAEGEQPDEDETFALLASLKRIQAFYDCHDLSNWGLWDDIFHIVRTAMDNTSIPDEIVCKSISASTEVVLWSLQKLNEESSPTVEEIHDLKKNLSLLMHYCQELLFHPQTKVVESAYIIICDMLVVFSKNLADTKPLLKDLIYEPDKNLQGQLSGFLTDRVFIDDDDDDVDENVKIEELHKKRNFLASFCKLIVYNVIHIRAAADMFKYYMRFYNDYGDIIKATLSKSREINKVSTAKTLALSLTQLYKDLEAEQGGIIDRASEPFQHIKELARRFALSFGLDQMKNREAVATLHKEGIIFSITPVDKTTDPEEPPVNIPFLEVLTEFTNKLMKQDKKTVVNYLDKHMPNVPQNRSEEWQPYLTYRNSLIQGEVEIHPITLRPAIPARPVGKSVRRKPEEIIVQPQGEVIQKRTSHRSRDEPDDDDSEQGSEKEFDEGSNMSMSQMSQAQMWLSNQQQRSIARQAETTYARTSRYANISREEDISDQAISEFSSPDMMQHHQQLQGTLFEDDSHISDDSQQRSVTPMSVTPMSVTPMTNPMYASHHQQQQPQQQAPQLTPHPMTPPQMTHPMTPMGPPTPHPHTPHMMTHGPPSVGQPPVCASPLLQQQGGGAVMGLPPQGLSPQGLSPQPLAPHPMTPHSVGPPTLIHQLPQGGPHSVGPMPQPPPTPPLPMGGPRSVPPMAPLAQMQHMSYMH